MHPPRAFFAVAILAVLGANTGAAQPGLGAQGAEGEPNRRQQWLVPSPDLATAHAVLFRPPGDGPFPLAVIAHASSQNVLRRAQMPQPEYRALAAWLVARGFAVLVPERPGHGATGGKYLEDQGGCDEADFARAGRATADVIAAAVGLVRKQSFIRPDGMVVIGHSAAHGVRWRWQAKIRRKSPPSSRLRPGAAGTPMICPTGSARRRSCSPPPANSARPRG
jgi:dienelactone hydrolase